MAQKQSFQIKEIANRLENKNPGFWLAKSTSKVFFPEEIHENFIRLETNSFWYYHRNELILEALRQFPPPQPFFDIGGGNGIVSMALQEAGIEVILVEPSCVGARNAFERGINTVICSTLEDAGFHSNTFPSVGLFDVVEHIESDNEFLLHINQLLQKGGLLYITVPAYSFLWSIEDEYTGHFRRYTIRKLKRLLNQVGFHIQYSTYFFTPLPLPIFLFRSLPSRLGVRRIKENQTCREHKINQKIIFKPLNWVFEKEIAFVRKQRKIPFGGSCLIIAEKI
uniref:Methyltransferase domain-containing protein n=1 Tax=Candidatus Kentrum sp. FW TaxID=2126338 RepID=A0A450TCM0_9GAMM|nr:MAG: Methyltransferase domain-containing protein [Candidatus Kentron sp. FW]